MSFYLAEKAYLTPPDPPERKPIYECKACKDGVCEDEDYIEYNDEIICYECLDQMTTSEILKTLNIQVHTA